MSRFVQRYLAYHRIAKPLLGILLVLLIFVSLGLFKQRGNNLEKVQVQVDDIVVHAWVADTKESRRDGLSILNTLHEDEGMLFVFEESKEYSFWMRGMNFPIDIVWLNEDKKVVYTKEQAEPKDYPEVYKSNDPALYALEFSSGFVEKNNIFIGKQFHWE